MKSCVRITFKLAFIPTGFEILEHVILERGLQMLQEDFIPTSSPAKVGVNRLCPCWEYGKAEIMKEESIRLE